MQGESGSDLLHVDSFVALCEDVTMVSEEDEVSLVVEGHYSSSFELGILWEQRGKESSDFDTDFGVKVIEYEFGYVLGGNGMMLDILLELDAGHLENS